MKNIQKAIFPAIILGSAIVVLVTSLISSPHSIVQASDGDTQTGTQNGDAQIQQPVESTSQSDCTLGKRFPEKIRQWCNFIEFYCTEHGLEPDLIAAVILQESGGNPDAYSKSGAVGLMQVMPRDGIAEKFMCQNGPCFSSRPSMAELYDPKFNISYGVKMLSGLESKHGSMREALRSYGPMDVGYSYADLVLSIFENYSD